MTSSDKYENWVVEQDTHEIVWLKIDVNDRTTNVLNTNTFNELHAILTNLSKKTPIGVAITSNKEKGFVAGADINEFTQITNRQQALDKCQFGQKVFDLLDQLSCPTIAVINGFCYGGGLEMSLACDYRIALDAPSTRLSLPEVRLGIHPGYGGTVRILRYVNPLIAMDLMLTGRSLDVRRAKKIGLIDHAVPKRLLKIAARKMLLGKSSKSSAPRISMLLNSKPARQIISSQMRKQVAKKALPEHYPAPFALIEHWVEYYGNEEEMLRHEAKSVAQLSTSETAKNLVRVFLLQEELKSLTTNTKTPTKHVHIIGAGIMGGDIATWCVSQGLLVTLQDLSSDSLGIAKSRAYKYFKKRLKNKYLIQDAMDRFNPDIDGNGLYKADVIIEAIFENKKVKCELYTSIEPLIRENAILATNTSSIKIEDLCDALSNPSRLIGLHFFNPVAKMPLIEIVEGENTNKEVKQHAINFAKQIGKIPLPTKSSPGFLVNRVLTPYMIEACLLKENGIPITEIDQAAKHFGMPMGPVELADTVGLDVGLHVAELLSTIYGYKVPESFKEMVASGNLGKKTGKGFYTWKKGKKIMPKNKSSTSDQKAIENRLVLRFINEAVACHRENIVENKNHLDAGIIFGTGFAPFLGGPIHYIETMGATKLLANLKALQQQYGDRFNPDSGWYDLK